MFTGIVDDIGTVERASRSPAGLELRVLCRYRDLQEGESIAVNGACLTVRGCGPGWFDVAAVETTLDRTTTGVWQRGRRVNLERALRLGDRLGGHLVQGHVDGIAVVSSVHETGDGRLIDLALPAVVADLVVLHGSLALDGVSLTVNALPASGVAQVSLIEYTLRHTTLGDLAPGDRAHVEADIIGKFVQRLMGPYGAASERGG